MKSEPESYSIDQFKRDKKTLWTGVRNYQARNFMMSATPRSMAVGDQVLFYHSNSQPSAVVGVGEITRTDVADPTALDPKSEYHDPKASDDHPIWFCAEVKYLGHLKTPLALEELRTIDQLSDMLLLKKGQRLSIMPVTQKEFHLIVKTAGGWK